MFASKKRCHPSVVGVSIVPRLATRLHFPVESRRATKPLFNIGRNLAPCREQRRARLPAKFPREPMVVQRLFTVAAVLGELQEDFAFPKPLQSVERGRPTPQL